MRKFYDEDYMKYFSNPVTLLEPYKIHILIFLLAFLTALTFAHPSILITDEWVTTNQLTQLYEGHQILFNEGKYGSLANGTPIYYFIEKQNYLAYPLFLPIISLPSTGLVYLFGDNFVFLIAYLWTFLLIALALVLNEFFPAYTYIGKWRWTTGLIAGIFLVFFLNLFFYSPFPLTGKEWSPEVMAIVFTNIILFAFLAVMIFEICRMSFENDSYSLFGTFVCLSCSSYLFWTNFCKDHALVAFLITAIILLFVKFLLTDNTLFLSGAFIISGLLAWARPELALLMAIVLCIVVIYILVFLKNRFSEKREWLQIFFSPLFTLLGAIPFFINNYQYTKNPFLPAFILWNTKTSSASSSITIIKTVPVQQNTDTLGSLLHLVQAGTNSPLSSFFTDLYGVFFNPQSGSMGIFPIVPLFLAAILLLPVLIIREKVLFTGKEKKLITGLLLISFGILFAYIRGIHGMNISIGIIPDMRYLSPIYLPLTLIGLMILKKITAISDKPLVLTIGMFSAWIILIPLSLIAISRLYLFPEEWKDLFPLLDSVISIVIYLLIFMFLICTIQSIVYKKPGFYAKFFLVLICALPLLWQIDATFLSLQYGTGLGGYSFWIPAVRAIFAGIFLV